MYSVDHIPNA